jgi:hypothetical protein
MTVNYELKCAGLEAQNAKLRAEIDNLQAPRPAPTIIEVIGTEAFDRMVELYPSFRESGTPTNHTDAASEVFWSAIRYLGRTEKALRNKAEGEEIARAELQFYRERNERMERALIEYALRAAEEVTL